MYDSKEVQKTNAQNLSSEESKSNNPGHVAESNSINAQDAMNQYFESNICHSDLPESEKINSESKLEDSLSCSDGVKDSCAEKQNQEFKDMGCRPKTTHKHACCHMPTKEKDAAQQHDHKGYQTVTKHLVTRIDLSHIDGFIYQYIVEFRARLEIIANTIALNPEYSQALRDRAIPYRAKVLIKLGDNKEIGSILTRAFVDYFNRLDVITKKLKIDSYHASMSVGEIYAVLESVASRIRITLAPGMPTGSMLEAFINFEFISRNMVFMLLIASEELKPLMANMIINTCNIFHLNSLLAWHNVTVLSKMQNKTSKPAYTFDSFVGFVRSGEACVQDIESDMDILRNEMAALLLQENFEASKIEK